MKGFPPNSNEGCIHRDVLEAARTEPSNSVEFFVGVVVLSLVVKVTRQADFRVTFSSLDVFSSYMRWAIKIVDNFFQVIDKYADRQDNYESEDEEENVAADETEKKLQLPSMSNGECGGSLTAGRSTNDGHKPCECCQS